MFRNLVLAWLIEWSSKAGKRRVLEEAGALPASYPTVNLRLRVHVCPGLPAGGAVDGMRDVVGAGPDQS